MSKKCIKCNANLEPNRTFGPLYTETDNGPICWKPCAADNRFLWWLKRRGSQRMIKRNGSDYLERYFLFKFRGVSLYLHRFWANDPDDPHCHPWWSLSWIVKGGYREHFADGTFLDREKGDKVLRDATTFHRIELPEGNKPGSAMTLFFTWRRKRDWGFLTKNGWINAGEYMQDSGDEVAVYGRDFITEGVFFPRIKWLTHRR